ncbi:hypothetical protein MNEG_7589 [Monoraphidium neglectum]|uniref:Ysc84 actin-binding domain-containing protein n=1 Tax=Monoraphidium neglectum TaxID=145388 RepID=A0A0D2MI49_9CHLO|nr:hypothetical protein MNEG_7589 [Monoraphidium neglectum]KIZ00377.1 hypothetical protein MNEG_7589 [Monoraphidium neglectum]|eukprot:XP_013899396.1 hypothetical protein MNEG_7589 [Monoraphidium neglectum]
MMAPLPPVMPATLPAPCPRRAHTQIGFGISVTQGYGLLVMRQPNAPSGWSAPLPLKVDGFSMGAVMGYSEQKSVVVLGSEEDVAVFLKDKRSLKMGLDFGLSLGKKVNHNATVDSETTKKAAEGESKTRAFTISKGFIVDVSLKGTSLEHDVDDMEAAYGEGTTPADVLQGSVRAPKQAQLLYNVLSQIEARVAA